MYFASKTVVYFMTKAKQLKPRLKQLCHQKFMMLLEVDKMFIVKFKFFVEFRIQNVYEILR